MDTEARMLELVCAGCASEGRTRGGLIPHGVEQREVPRVVVGFRLGWRDVADGAEEAVIVEPVYPAQGCHFHRRSVWP